MKAIEKHYAKKNIRKIQAALNSGKIVDMAKALHIDLTDPQWSNMPFSQASGIMQIRLESKVKRFQELMGGKND